MVQWYDDKKNLFELADFMVESEQINTAKELLAYFKNPERYTNVWKLYCEEILGKPKKEIECKFKNVPDIVALVKPSSICG